LTKTLKNKMAAIGFYIFYAFAWLISLLPLPILYVISDIFYFFIYIIFGYRKKIVRKNLKNAFPEKSKKELLKIEKKFYHHLIDIFIETIKIMHISDKEIKRRNKFINIDIAKDLFKTGKAVIGVVGHYNNWEWFNNMQLYSKHQGLAIFKPINNKRFEKFMNKIREKYGALAVPMHETLRKLIQLRKEGILPFSLMVADQSPVKEEINYWTRFLNQDTPVYLGVEKIAKKFDYAVVFMKMRKVKRGYYETEIVLITDKPKETKDFEITERHVALLENLIKEQPEYWIWSHRRWKHKKTKIND